MSDAPKLTETKFDELLREVVRREILKDPRPTLETLKALHSDRPLLVLALDLAITSLARTGEWREIRSEVGLPTDRGIVYQWITFFNSVENTEQVGIANYNILDHHWYWQETGNRVPWTVLAYQKYAAPEPFLQGEG